MTSDYREQWDRSLCPLRDIRYKKLTFTRCAADRLCGGKLVMVHEGGYAESYVPFCGLAVMEQLSGVRTEVQDPLLAFIQQQQPRDAFNRFQREALDELARQFGL